MKSFFYGVVLISAFFLTGCFEQTKADAGKDQTVKSGQIVTLDGNASIYAANKKLLYSWKQTKGTPVVLRGENSIKATFVAPVVRKKETLIFQLTLKEKDTQTTSTDSVKITVKQSADKTPPVITIKGENPVEILQGTPYTDAGATAIDARDGKVSVSQSGSVNSTKVGTYKIIYTAKDKAGNRATAERVVMVRLVPDTIPPVITIKGKNPVEILQGTPYTDAGATAIDARDGKVSVSQSGSVNSTKVGTYKIIYTAKDKAGNRATAERVVMVRLVPDTISPVITIKGENPIKILEGTSYTDAGATAIDARDGKVSVTQSGSVDSNKAGRYKIIYTARDKAGNSIIAERIVIVLKEIIPAKVLKTGQTSSYTQYDDGDYQLGTARSYSRNNEKKVVIDNVTGLMWQDDIEAKTIQKPWVTQVNWNLKKQRDTSGDTAITYCENLILGGYDDWRLPSRMELRGLVDFGKMNPSLDISFLHVASENYWSNTPFSFNSKSVWAIHFNYGIQGNVLKTERLYVRCVRVIESY